MRAGGLLSGHVALQSAQPPLQPPTPRHASAPPCAWPSAPCRTCPRPAPRPWCTCPWRGLAGWLAVAGWERSGSTSEAAGGRVARAAAVAAGKRRGSPAAVARCCRCCDRCRAPVGDGGGARGQAARRARPGPGSGGPLRPVCRGGGIGVRAWAAPRCRERAGEARKRAFGWGGEPPCSLGPPGRPPHSSAASPHPSRPSAQWQGQ